MDYQKACEIIVYSHNNISMVAVKPTRLDMPSVVWLEMNKTGKNVIYNNMNKIYGYHIICNSETMV